MDKAKVELKFAETAFELAENERKAVVDNHFRLQELVSEMLAHGTDEDYKKACKTAVVYGDRVDAANAARRAAAVRLDEARAAVNG